MIEGRFQLEQIIKKNGLATVSEDDIRDWYSTLYDEIEPIKKRYKKFSVTLNNFYFLIILPLFIIQIFLLTTPALFIFLYWLIIFLFYLYFQDIIKFIAVSFRKERNDMRKELIHLLNIQEELIKECMKRHLVILKKDLHKELTGTQNLRAKLIKVDLPYYD